MIFLRLIDILLITPSKTKPSSRNYNINTYTNIYIYICIDVMYVCVTGFRTWVRYVKLLKYIYIYVYIYIYIYIYMVYKCIYI